MDLNNFNNFNKESNESENNDSESNNTIDIFVKQRNGRKSITTIKGLCNNKKKLKLITKVLNKKMSCSGSVVKRDDEFSIVFTGKDVKTISEYILSLEEYKDYDVRVHGGIE